MNLPNKILNVLKYINSNSKPTSKLYRICPFVIELVDQLGCHLYPIDPFGRDIKEYLNELAIYEIFRTLTSIYGRYDYTLTFDFTHECIRIIIHNNDIGYDRIVEQINTFNQSIQNIHMISDQYHETLDEICDIILQSPHPSLITTTNHSINAIYVYKLLLDLKIVMVNDIKYWNSISVLLNVVFLTIDDIYTRYYNTTNTYSFISPVNIYHNIESKNSVLYFMNQIYNLLESYYISTKSEYDYDYKHNPILIKCYEKLQNIQQMLLV